jgi:hypothetical protein
MINNTLKKSRKKITDKDKDLMSRLKKEYLSKNKVKYFIGDTQVSKAKYDKHHVR